MIKMIKKYTCILTAAVCLMTSCQTKTQPNPVETSLTKEKETTITETSSVQQTSAAEEQKIPSKETGEKDSTKETEESTEKENNTEKESSTAKETSAADKPTEETEKIQESEESNAEEPSPSSQAPEQSASKKSVQDIYDEITRTVELNSPMILPDSFIFNYYGIDVSTLEEYVFSMSEAAISAETIVILKVKDGESTENLRSALQVVIDQKKAEMENYLPEQFQIVNKSSVQVKDNYLYLVISEQADAISQIIQAEI